jgi:hypothetical protein
MSLYPQCQGKNTALTWLKASVKPLTDRSRVDGKSQTAADLGSTIG